jgi:hypothetical protein
MLQASREESVVPLLLSKTTPRSGLRTGALIAHKWLVTATDFTTYPLVGIRGNNEAGTSGCFANLAIIVYSLTL